MVQISEKKRPVKGGRRASQARHGPVDILNYQMVSSGQRGRRAILPGPTTSNIQGTVRALRGDFSGDSSIYREGGTATVVGTYGTVELPAGLDDTSERSALAAQRYVFGGWGSFPTGDVISPSDAGEIDFRTRTGGAASPEFAEGEFTSVYNDRELNQEPDHIEQMAPTQGPAFFRHEYGFRVESMTELDNEPKPYDIPDLLSSAYISTELGHPRDLHPVAVHPAAHRWAPSSNRASITEWETVSRRPLRLSVPFSVVADRINEGVLRHSISDLNVDSETDLKLLSSWEDSSWSVAATVLSEGRMQHQLAIQFSLGIDGETPPLPVVNMVDRIARAVESKTANYVYSVDEDGAFSFEAWLANGQFIMCEVDLYGEINAGLYLSPTGPQETFRSCITEKDLLDIL